MPDQISSTFPILTTERLTLRQPSENDGAEVFLLRSDTTVNKYLHRKPTSTPADAVSFIKKVNEHFKNKVGIYWAITQMGHEKLIGTICLFGFSNELKKCEIGYELSPDYQGRGLMHEAIRKVIEFAFQTLGIDAIEAHTHKDNHSSTRLLQKLHFEEKAHFDEANPNLVVFRLSN